MTVGSLCSGIGFGLEAAVGGELAYVADIDPGANQVLAERHPTVPNLGDWTQTDLPVTDWIVAGLPCQPVSTAGRRAGTEDDRWLFDDLADAVGRMDTRPGLFLENVPGLLTVNGGNAMARVVHRLAGLGYVGRWGLVRASDAGAPHRRERWFCIAEHGDSPATGRIGGGLPGPQADSGGSGGIHRDIGHGSANATGATGDPHGMAGSSQGQQRTEHHLRSDGGGEGTDAGSGGTTADTDGQGPQGRRIESIERGGERTTGPSRVALHRSEDDGSLSLLRASRYGLAVQRWEYLTRPAPAPLDGRNRLNPPFLEWMMGLPAGWVTDILGRTASLKALGNAVVPQQAALAWEQL